VTPEPQDPGASGVSRRQALRRMATVGGAVWVAPALQTINMAGAKAGSPRELCFSVKIPSDGDVELPGPNGQGFACIEPVTGSDGRPHVTPLSTRAGRDWKIDLGSCRFVEGAVRSEGESASCRPLRIPPGTTGVITAPRFASGPHGLVQDISHVELTFCRDA
jgi:hypothetical protein